MTLVLIEIIKNIAQSDCQDHFYRAAWNADAV